MIFELRGVLYNIVTEEYKDKKYLKLNIGTDESADSFKFGVDENAKEFISSLDRYHEYRFYMRYSEKYNTFTVVDAVEKDW
jgi:hypothetical protein